MRDKKTCRSAEIIRLLVDDQRGHCGPWANDVYQQHFLGEVQEFIGPTSAILVTDAGSIKAYVQRLDANMNSLPSGLTALGEALSPVDVGRMEMFLGVDGCICGETTHLQTVVHLWAKPKFPSGTRR